MNFCHFLFLFLFLYCSGRGWETWREISTVISYLMHMIVLKAVDLAKRFCDGAAPRIINGCLRTFVKHLEQTRLAEISPRKDDGYSWFSCIDCLWIIPLPLLILKILKTISGISKKVVWELENDFLVPYFFWIYYHVCI